MKRILSIFVLLLVLLFNVKITFAITVTATPPSVDVGNNVSVNVSSVSSVNNPCQINVVFGDASSSIINCTAGSVCGGVLNHIYTASGIYTVTATESGGCMNVAALPPGTDTVTVSCPTFTITTASMPGGVVGQPYYAQLQSSGGVAPITWEVADTFSLPNGLTISSTGLVSGMPTTYGVTKTPLAAEDDCVPSPQYIVKPFTINITSPATAELTITRLQLSFENGRAETTVNRNQPGLQANADLRFDGSGLLEGYWEVDGRLLSRINQHLTYGKSITLTTPAVPFLPTFVEGSHRVRLVIISPANNITFPEAIYYVTSEDSRAELAPLRITAPRNHAELSFAAQSFSWEGSETAVMYLVEFFEREDENPVAAAYTKTISYDLPESILTDSFNSGKAYFWWVKSYDAEGNLVGVSELSKFVFQ